MRSKPHLSHSTQFLFANELNQTQSGRVIEGGRERENTKHKRRGKETVYNFEKKKKKIIKTI